jgi:hypothetical protein
MQKKSVIFNELFKYLQQLPLVDCHDHTNNAGPVLKDPIHALVEGYFFTDLVSVLSDTDTAYVTNTQIPWEERWPTLQKAWRLAKNTGYGMMLKKVLREFYDSDELTLETMKSMEGKLLQLEDPQVFEAILEKAKIKVRIADIWDDPDVAGKRATESVLDGTLRMAPRAKLTIPLRDYHRVFSYEDIQSHMKPLKRTVTSLDEYLAGCYDIFSAYKQFGAVAFKDQSAYRRRLNYGNPTKSEAEKVFNYYVSNQRTAEQFPGSRQALDDYLFHELLRMAREIDLPVQLHTGLLAGTRQDVSGANAILLAPILEQHRDVRFDLFHANWPYGGEWLFLGKNYPNVYLNFCWANIIDPLYCQNLFQQAISSVPAGKIFLFGADLGGYADHAWAHAQMARENLAIALSNLVEIDYLSIDEAKDIAILWCYENPVNFFNLDLHEFSS